MYKIKKTIQIWKMSWTKIWKNLRKKESNRSPGNKNFLKSSKKYRGKPLQQTRTSGRQNVRTSRQNRC
jgi:hypothetical protein